MRALTLRPPAAYAVAHLGKLTENRTWRPPRTLLGKHLAIHAAARPTGDDAHMAARIAARTGAVLPDDLPHGVIVAVVRVAGVRAADDPDPWFTGPFGWVLTDLLTLPEPLVCSGGRGLWNTPRAVSAQLRALLKAHNT